MTIRLIFKILLSFFTVGLLTVGIYALGVQFNWYGELESRGDLVDDRYPENLLLQKIEAQLKHNS